MGVGAKELEDMAVLVLLLHKGEEITVWERYLQTNQPLLIHFNLFLVGLGRAQCKQRSLK